MWMSNSVQTMDLTIKHPLASESEDDISFLAELYSELDLTLDDEDDDFLSFKSLEPLELRKAIIADHIKSLLYYTDQSQSAICDKLGWKKSRISKILSGKANLTIKTLFEISRTLGYDFDVVFFNDKSLKPFIQPWERNQLVKFNHATYFHHHYWLEFIEGKDIQKYIDSTDHNSFEAFISIKNKMKDITQEKVIDVDNNDEYSNNYVTYNFNI